MHPTVSICLPNLNNRPFLAERLKSIFSQTFTCWELIVVDSYSDDGAWEFFEEQAVKDSRIRISQAPRGLYESWNECVRQARGKYIYFATSDDTMMPTCLEKMVEALEANLDCGICQCGLTIIDENHQPVEHQWIYYSLGSYDQDLVLRGNKRLAPHDGFLHPALFTIYTSITQLMIRRTVFDRIGLFDGQWGACSDFEWEMRAGLVENCIFVPEELATWRIHPIQATQNPHTVEGRQKMIEMTGAAFARALSLGGDGIKRINLKDLMYFLERDLVELGFKESHSYRQKLVFLLRQLKRLPRPVVDFVIDRLLDKKWGLWRCSNRYSRLKRLLSKYAVPGAVFV